MSFERNPNSSESKELKNENPHRIIDNRDTLGFNQVYGTADSQVFPEFISNSLKAGDYQRTSNALIIHLDRLEGVRSNIVLDPFSFPTGIGIVREPDPTLQRRPPKDLLITSTNAMQRCLAIARGIHHALGDNNPAQKDINEVLINLFDKIKSAQQAFHDDDTKLFTTEKLEKEANTKLFNILQQQGLTREINTEKQARLLLEHYRNLATLLEPAKSVVSTVKETIKNTQGEPVIVTHITSAHPITHKTDEQLKQLSVMSRYRSNDPDAGGFHYSKEAAFRQANLKFADLIIQHNRSLPAQTRKTIAPTVKNGFIVHDKIIIDQNNTQKIEESLSLRCGSLVYIGSGEKIKNIVDKNNPRDEKPNIGAYVKENLKQINDALKAYCNLLKINFNPAAIHLTILNTEAHELKMGDTSISPLDMDHQNLIVKQTRSAIDSLNQDNYEKHFELSYAPLNTLGRLQQTISEEERTAAQRDRSFTHRLSNAIKATIPAKPSSAVERMNEITKIAATVKDQGKINIHLCASGQDRTTIAQEATRLTWEESVYAHNHIPATRQAHEHRAALLAHGALMATITAPGSQGVKPESKPAEYFSTEFSEILFRDTANTNKKPILDKNIIFNKQATYKEITSQIPLESPNGLLQLLKDFAAEGLATEQKKANRNAAEKLFGGFARLYNKGAFTENTQERMIKDTMLSLMQNILNANTLEEALIAIKTQCTFDKNLLNSKNALPTVYKKIVNLYNKITEKIKSQNQKLATNNNSNLSFSEANYSSGDESKDNVKRSNSNLKK